MNYIVSAQKSTCVMHSVTGNFTGPNDINLIIGKNTHFEIYTLNSDGLKPLIDVPIYGRIETMILFRPKSKNQDFLFITTERHNMCILSYDATNGEIITEAEGDLRQNQLRQSDYGKIAAIDPSHKIISLQLYTGFLRCIQLDDNGLPKEYYDIKQEELRVIDIVHLEGYTKPTIAVLYQDTKDAKHVKTYEIFNKELVEGPWSCPNVESGASKLIPVPKPIGGVVIVCEQSISYHNGPGTIKSIPMNPTVVECYGKIDADGSRYLLGDHKGNLMILFLKIHNERVQELKMELLGQTSIARSLSYLDNGFVYVGSSSGDSQLIKLKTRSEQPGKYIEVVESYTNLGPIMDFCFVDIDKQGQGQIVSCSGKNKDGSIRVIRNGVGINELAVLELPGISGMWSFGKSSKEKSCLALSFVGETRFFSFASEEVEEISIESFSNHLQTLFCGNVGDFLVQATEASLSVVAENHQLVDKWTPPESLKITSATVSGDNILLSVGGGRIYFFELKNSKLVLLGESKLNNEISCISLPPGSNPNYCIVGFWIDISVCTLALPSFRVLHRHQFTGEIIPRSLEIADFEGKTHLFAGLGDGQLYSFSIEKNGELKYPTRAIIGTQPIQLSSFKTRDVLSIFASSDRPTVIYSSNKKILFSNVNMKEVKCVADLNCSQYPNSLAIATKEGLTIGNIDEIQKLHIRTIPLGEMPLKIVHHEQSSSFAVLTINSMSSEEENCFVKLLNDQTFDVLSSFKLDQWEIGMSVCVINQNNTNYICVGTALALPREDEPQKGRVLVFTVSENKALKLLTYKEVKGSVYCISPFNGKILCGINNKVTLFKWTESERSTYELVSECGHHGHTLVYSMKVQGDFILVGDFMKSVSLLLYKPIDGKIEEIAHDSNINYMSAVEFLEDDLFIGAENSCNIFCLKRNSGAERDEERKKLETVGQVQIGGFINKFQKGSLSINRNEIQERGTIIYGTRCGSIGIISRFTEEEYNFFQQVQKNLSKVVKGVGGIDHKEWRSFSNDRRKGEFKGFIDGDLLESFLDLKKDKKKDVIEGRSGGEPLNTTVEELTEKIQALAGLH